MAILVHGWQYFGKRGFPIAIRRARCEPDGGPSHPFDVTEVPHYHDFTELVIVLGGTGLHYLEGESFPVAAGNVFVVQGMQIHWFKDRRDLQLLNVMFDPNRLPLPNRLLRRLPGFSAIFLLEPAYRRIHRFSSRLNLNRGNLGIAETLAVRIEQELNHKGPGFDALAFAHLVELSVFLSRCYGETPGIEVQSLVRVGTLISALERDYREAWTLDRMARIANLSRSGLLRTFRRATGQPPIAYLINRRMEAAMGLLRGSDRTITEIAFEVGFEDANYFTRQFRKTIGMTPRGYRTSESR